MTEKLQYAALDSQTIAGSRRWPLGSTLITLAALTSPWTGIRIGTFGLTDFVLVAAALVVSIEHFARLRRLQISLWMVLPTAAAFILFAGTNLLGSRIIGGDGDSGATFIWRTFLGLTLIAVFSVSEVQSFGKFGAHRLIYAWAIGVAVSAGVAVLDSTGATSFYLLVEHLESPRSVGLANHPNSLAQSLVLALPVLILASANTSNGRRQRTLWVVAIGVVGVASFLANSRGGLLVGLMAAAVSIAVILWKSGARWFLPSVIVLVPAIAFPFLDSALRSTRLADGSAAESDSLRLAYLREGWDAFLSSPIFGSGLQTGAGVMVPLYLASLGGVVLLFGYYIFIGQNVVRMRRALDDPTVRACFLSGLALLAMGLVNNSINERFDYWVICVGAALASLRMPSRATD
jgi:hypothetical protein